MRALIGWLVIGLGLGTITAIVRYIAVWYVMRRVRRAMSWRRRQQKGVQT